MPVPTPISPAGSLDERAAHEPSMEEILASIRRIISDDQSLAAHRDPLPPDQPREPIRAENDPAPLHEMRSAPVYPPQQPVAAFASQERPHLIGNVQETPKEAPKTVNIEEHRAFSGPAHSTSPQAASFERKPADFADMRLRRQLHDDGDRAQAYPARRRTIEPVPLPAQAPSARQAATFQDEEPIVSPATDAAVASSFNALFASRLLPNPEMLAEMTRDLLRPMLKAWLDDNLPVMVERLVRAEIERVARGGL
jgi:uncharacterized protein